MYLCRGPRPPGFPGVAFQANGEQQRSGRARTFFRLSQTADISIDAAYLSTYQVAPYMQNSFLYSAASGGLPSIPPITMATGPSNMCDFERDAIITTQQTTLIFTGGLTGNWRPASWLSAYADAGLDRGSQLNRDH